MEVLPVRNLPVMAEESAGKDQFPQPGMKEGQGDPLLPMAMASSRLSTPAAQE